MRSRGGRGAKAIASAKTPGKSHTQAGKKSRGDSLSDAVPSPATRQSKEGDADEDSDNENESVPTAGDEDDDDDAGTDGRDEAAEEAEITGKNRLAILQASRNRENNSSPPAKKPKTSTGTSQIESSQSSKAATKPGNEVSPPKMRATAVAPVSRAPSNFNAVRT